MDQLELRLSARNALAQAQTLAQEIDHRVMNSLQFISSMLAMQSRSPGNDAAGQLEVAANRVATVARVHRHFSAGIVGDGIDCLPFIRRLCEDLSGVLGKTIVIDGDDEEVSAKTMQSVGLIVNELVTNAAKHGDGTIAVSYVMRGDRRILTAGEGTHESSLDDIRGDKSERKHHVDRSFASPFPGRDIPRTCNPSSRQFLQPQPPFGNCPQ